jgi:N-acetyl-anhydromuramyl-L-alanine amidase AmpD
LGFCAVFKRGKSTQLTGNQCLIHLYVGYERNCKLVFPQHPATKMPQSEAKPTHKETKSMTKTILKSIALVGAVAAMSASASTDYAPAIWSPAYSGHWYTSGYGHKFHVIHDMEGYYLSTISYFKQSGTQASVHYCVNGKKDTSTDHAAGEVTQMVLEAYYAWHALCWNQHSTGTEHEGFVSNPAWYTDAQYQASADLTRHLGNKFGWAKDRNHIVGHDAKKSSAWVSWAGPNLGIDPTCNSHTDPGQYWDWTKYMNMVNPPTTTSTIVDNSSAGFSVTGTWATGSSSTDKYGADYRYHSTAAVSEPANWSANITAGSHSVYAWWPAGSNRSATSPYIVYHGAGSTTVSKNQQANGGSWQLLGTWSDFASGANNVKLSCWTTTGYIVVADAVKWQ